LAIQGSATLSKHSFSSGGLIRTQHQNCLYAHAFESLQSLKSVYRNGHILAANDAEQHLDELISALEVEADADDMPALK
jgi:hypothetical protein